jgi:hypothetical protein
MLLRNSTTAFSAYEGINSYIKTQNVLSLHKKHGNSVTKTETKLTMDRPRPLGIHSNRPKLPNTAKFMIMTIMIVATGIWRGLVDCIQSAKCRLSWQDLGYHRHIEFLDPSNYRLYKEDRLILIFARA